MEEMAPCGDAVCDKVHFILYSLKLQICLRQLYSVCTWNILCPVNVTMDLGSGRWRCRCVRVMKATLCRMKNSASSVALGTPSWVSVIGVNEQTNSDSYIHSRFSNQHTACLNLCSPPLGLWTPVEGPFDLQRLRPKLKAHVSDRKSLTQTHLLLPAGRWLEDLKTKGSLCLLDGWQTIWRGYYLPLAV